MGLARATVEVEDDHLIPSLRHLGAELDREGERLHFGSR